MTETGSANALIPQQKRGVKEVLLSYFYWTYPRGCFHYDVMVSLILAFIFITPHLWNYGAMPSANYGLVHPIEVIGNGTHGIVVTVQGSDVDVPADASTMGVRKALREAIEPVTGDAVIVDRWMTVTDAQGNVAWKVWAHR